MLYLTAKHMGMSSEQHFQEAQTQSETYKYKMKGDNPRGIGPVCSKSLFESYGTK